MHPEFFRDLLLQIASQGPVTLADLHSLEALLERGLLLRVEAPRSEGLRIQYEGLQGKHQRLLEAKALVDRLQTPRKGLSRWLSTTDSPPSGQEWLALHSLLEEVGIKVRDCSVPDDLVPRLDRVREHLLVEDRECMDRMASLDREINALEKQGSGTVLVEPFGHVALSQDGRKLLPETSVLEELETVFNLVSGPRRQKITDYEHFRRDPATLLAFVLANPSGLGRSADIVDAFEALAQALDWCKDLQKIRHRNALIIRLLRRFRGQPKWAHFWCGRERLQELGASAKSLVPPSMAQSGDRFIYAADLLLAGPGSDESAQGFEERQRLMGTVQSSLGQALGPFNLGEIPMAHLTLALMHEALARNVVGPVLAGRLVQRMAEASLEAMAHAPADLGDPSMRLLFGYHLAHWADFQASRIPTILEAYNRIEGAFAPEGRRKRVSSQVLLHALAVLERLKSLGSAVAPEEYAGTFQRILRRLQSHKDLSRAFQAEHFAGEEELCLVANLTAQAYFSEVQAKGRCLPDAGPAGAYEDMDRPAAPLLGQAFGTLFL